MKSDDFVRLYLCTFHKTGYFTDYILSVIFVFDILICIEPASAPQGSIQQDLLVKKGITTMKEKKNVTFSDIANYTNFSKTTISRYFNNPDSLTLENQQIISDALVKLGYQENKVARILANGKTEFIGIIIPDLYYLKSRINYTYVSRCLAQRVQ